MNRRILLTAALLLPPGPHPAGDELRQYAAGTLAPAAEHRIEAHTLACEQCADVVAGFAMGEAAETDRAVAALRQRLQVRVAAGRVAEPVAVAGRFRWPQLAAAAAVAGALAAGIWGWQRHPLAPESAAEGAVSEVAATTPKSKAADAKPAVPPDAVAAENAAEPAAKPAPAVAAGPAANQAVSPGLGRIAEMQPGPAVAVQQVPTATRRARTATTKADADVAAAPADAALSSADYAPAGAAGPPPPAAPAQPSADLPDLALGSTADREVAAEATEAKMAKNEAREKLADDRRADHASAAPATVATTAAARPARALAKKAKPGRSAPAPAEAARAETLPPGPGLAPVPAGGLPTLQTYLRREAARFRPAPETGRLSGGVTLRFTVGDDGKLSNISVVQGLRADYDVEARRLLEAGPRWVPGIVAGQRAARPVEVTVPF